MFRAKQSNGCDVPLGKATVAMRASLRRCPLFTRELRELTEVVLAVENTRLYVHVLTRLMVNVVHFDNKVCYRPRQDAP